MGMASATSVTPDEDSVPTATRTPLHGNSTVPILLHLLRDASCLHSAATTMLKSLRFSVRIAGSAQASNLSRCKQ